MGRLAAGGVLLLAVLALLSGCGGGAPEEGARPAAPGESAGAGPRVVATTAQIAALAREVAGDRARVRAILEAGVDPHRFEATAADLTALSEADLVLRHGIGLDDFLDDVIGGAGRGPVVTVTEGIALEAGVVAAGSGSDPHVWLDPTLAQVMVEKVRDALVGVDPEGRDMYVRNAESYNRLLDETDRQVRALIESIPPGNRKMVTNHDGFGYFARRYGLEVVGAVIPTLSSEGEPSAREAAALLDIIRREGVKAIFTESSANPDLARQLARDAGVRVVDNLYVDSLGEPGSGAETVDGMLLANARLIAEALR